MARYVEMAARCVDDILDRGKLPIVAGGTGLYIDSLLSGRTFAPFSPTAPCGQLERELAEKGGQAMLEALAQVDPGGGRPPPPQRPQAHCPGPGGLPLHRQDHHPAQPGDPGHSPRYNALTIGLAFQDREAMGRASTSGWTRWWRRAGGRRSPAAHQRRPPKCTAMQAIGYKGDDPGPGWGHDLAGGHGGGKAALPAVRQAPAHLVSAAIPAPTGCCGTIPGICAGAAGFDRIYGRIWYIIGTQAGTPRHRKKGVLHMQKTNNLQEIFLTQVRRERRNVTVF